MIRVIRHFHLVVAPERRTRATPSLGLRNVQSVVVAVFWGYHLLSAQSVQLRAVTSLVLPGATDSNSPAHWQGGSLYVFNSFQTPVRSEGSDLFHLGQTRGVIFPGLVPRTRWIEATWLDDDGVLYAWYHHEPGTVCEGLSLTAPKIGALISRDGGISFADLGFVLESGDEANCTAANGYFASGNGDLSVILDRDREYFYFFFGNYGGAPSSQGVAVARMPFENRAAPVGAVWKYHGGTWSSPGLKGSVTPIFPASVG